MNLTTKNTARINSYLEEIGIDYLDIRLEMLDHLASEIENSVKNQQDFFTYKGADTPFIKFMYIRQKSLIKQYKKELLHRTKNDIKTLLYKTVSNIFTIKGLFALGVTILFYSIFKMYYDFDIILLIIIHLSALAAPIPRVLNKKLNKIRISKSYAIALLFIYYALLLVAGLHYHFNNNIFIPLFFVVLFFQNLTAISYYELSKKIMKRYTAIL